MNHYRVAILPWSFDSYFAAIMHRRHLVNVAMFLGRFAGRRGANDSITFVLDELGSVFARSEVIGQICLRGTPTDAIIYLRARTTFAFNCYWDGDM